MKFKLTHIIGTLSFLVTSHGFSQSMLTETYLTMNFGVHLLVSSANIEIGMAPNYGSTPATLFEDISFRTADVGHVYTVGPSDDPDFATFVAYLTDGRASVFSFFAIMGRDIMGGGGGKVASSEKYFFTLPPVNNGVDLGGYQIDYVSWRLDVLEFTSPGQNLGGDGIWTDCSCAGTFSVYGEPVPEPSLLAMLSMGMVVLCAKVKWLTGAAANRRPAGQLGGSGEFARDRCSRPGVSGGGR